MSVGELMLFTVYIIAGSVTIGILSKYKMYIAQAVYTVVFLLFASYFPVDFGKNLIYHMISSRFPELESYVYDGVIEPALSFYRIISIPLAATVVFSIFFSITVIIFAFYTAKAIYTLVIRKRSGRYFRKRRKDSTHVIYKGEVVPFCAYRYIFCRYNC